MQMRWTTTMTTAKPNRSNPDQLLIGLVSISDRAAGGVYQDQGIPALQDWLAAALTSPFLIETRLIPDERAQIAHPLLQLVDQLQCDLVLTTRGTRPAPGPDTPASTL